MAVPRKNCLKCKFYDACAEYDDGRCLLELKNDKGAKIHISNGFALTQAEWAVFLGVSRQAISVAVNKGDLDELFERCVKRELIKMQDAERGIIREGLIVFSGRIPKKYEYFGESKTVRDWAEYLCVSPTYVREAISRNVFVKRFGKRYKELQG